MTIGRSTLAAPYWPLASLLGTFSCFPIFRRTKLGFELITLVGILGRTTRYWAKMSTIAAPTEDYNWTSPTGREVEVLRGLGMMRTGHWDRHDNFGRAGVPQRLRGSLYEGSPTSACGRGPQILIEVAAEMGILESCCSSL